MIKRLRKLRMRYGRVVWVGGGFVPVAAIIAAWIAFGVGGGGGGSSSCPLPAYPTATCTGVPTGTTLTTDPTTNYVVSSANAVIDGLDLPNGCFDVRAPGVTIKNSKMQCVTTIQSATVENPANAPLTIQDSEIDCGGAAGNAIGGTGVSGGNWRAYRLNIVNCANGVDMDHDDILQDSYLHDLQQCSLPDCGGIPEPPGQPHTDGVQTGTGVNLVIVHNTIEGWSHCAVATGCKSVAFGQACAPPDDGRCNGTSSLSIGGSQTESSVRDVLIRDNVLSGGGYSIYCANKPPTNVRVLDNAFSTVYSPRVGEFGPSAGDCSETGVTQSGNFILQTHAPLHLE